MDGSFAIAETYIRIEDAVPTAETLERRAAQLEAYARAVGLEVFGHGLSLEVLVEPEAKQIGGASLPYRRRVIAALGRMLAAIDPRH